MNTTQDHPSEDTCDKRLDEMIDRFESEDRPKLRIHKRQDGTLDLPEDAVVKAKERSPRRTDENDLEWKRRLAEEWLHGEHDDLLLSPSPQEKHTD